ncbi:winged helix-turn-helix domain-containing protein [Serratia ureilytica]|uniref:winged helix-turn-helix domain-containing protein n=1 Tax=Serratia ureilytica TaxID=300181 RepID=UPI0018D5AE9D|nr:winged helix-turn-helix domain-containing protein [Serratia ureilytica]MBH3107635.1 winged helix-turn-helix domain-containing protein [Serratia ureilytica]MBN5281937.1 winged helix-turn-helix domain-containing protein [Serratia ureilytica]MBN5372778.1 winged helix-turn-helix domain-containing protein [Serratia ureilytica]
MKYRFNDHILFDADTRTLSPIDFSDDPISISSPSKRLLLLLIAHHGEAVGRELIFKKVWDDYGMVSSNNNLNQCVSKLRRVIKNLGVEDEVIATVPKVGFMLRDEITIECCEDVEDIPDEEPASPLPKPASEESANPPSENVIYGATSRLGYFRRWWLKISALVLGGILMATAITAYFSGSGTRQESYLGKSGNCKVFMSLPDGSASVNASLNRDILAYAAHQTGECSGDEFLLVVRSNQVRAYISGISRLFLLRCKILREHKMEICSGLESDSAEFIN